MVIGGDSLVRGQGLSFLGCGTSSVLRAFFRGASVGDKDRGSFLLATTLFSGASVGEMNRCSFSLSRGL